VKNSTAEKLQFRGEPITITIDTGNGLVERKTKMQCVQQVELINKYGERVLVHALGVEKISGVVMAVEVSGVKELFSTSVQSKLDCLADRPEGEEELLIGSKIAGLYPYTLEKVGDLEIMKSQFCHGFLLTSRNNYISVEGVYWPENVSAVRQGKYKLRGSGYSVNRQMVTSEEEQF
jgi:hypothetical protein